MRNSSGVVAQDPEGAWWQQFDDAELDSLVRRALVQNLDLRIAYDRVREARAVFVGNELDLAPHVPLQAAYAHSDEQEPGFGTQRVNAASYSLGFDASWEIDLFGHVRRSIEAARADLGAQQENLRDAAGGDRRRSCPQLLRAARGAEAPAGGAGQSG